MLATICTVTPGADIFTLANASSSSTSSPTRPELVITRSPFFRDSRATRSFFCRRDISKKNGTKLTSIIRMGMNPESGELDACDPPEGAGAPGSCATPGVPTLG